MINWLTLFAVVTLSEVFVFDMLKIAAKLTLIYLIANLTTFGRMARDFKLNTLFKPTELSGKEWERIETRK